MTTLKEAQTKIANLEHFVCGNLSGWKQGNVYLVISYNEIIGTSTIDGRARNYAYNAYDHSKTTSKHTNLMRKAWGI